MHAMPSLLCRKLIFIVAMKKRTRECCLPAPRQAADVDQRSTLQQELYRGCLGEESDKEEGQALRRRPRATVQAPDGCSSPDAAATAAFSSTAAHQSTPQRQAKAALAEDIAAVHLQRRLAKLYCSSALYTHKPRAFACSGERCAKPWGETVRRQQQRAEQHEQQKRSRRIQEACGCRSWEQG